MAEQNTKSEWEKQLSREIQYAMAGLLIDFGITANPLGLKPDEFIKLFKEQRRQLREQVLEAVGKDKEIFYPNDGGTYFQITPYVNEEKAEIRKRIEAIFDDEVVK